MWTYNVTDNLMVELKTIIALVTMTYILEKNRMSYINWVNECSMISLVINKYVLQTSF